MAADDDLPRMLSGRYRLEATIGHGGMGVVYRGTDLTMQRPIAVKLIRAVDGVELDDEIAGRFLREAKNTARLQHEHIIDVFDLGRDDSGMYFVMELLNGESLSARIRREGKMPSDVVVHIGRQICEALEVAHRTNIIHRDLKPANVMLLSRAGDENFVKVLDFGVAKSYAGDDQTQLTHTGMLVGTVDYMAPEQIMGKPVDGRSDIYSLGVMLYKMLCGKNPFRDGGVPALIHAHLNTMPKPLIEMNADVPNGLDHVVLRCLAKNPDRRFESMAEVARALTSTIAGTTGNLLDLEYRGANDSYSDDGDATAFGSSYSGDPAPSDDPTTQDSMMKLSPEDLARDDLSDLSDDETIQYDRMKAQRKLTAEELGLTAQSPSKSKTVPPGGLRRHEGHHPLPPPPKPRNVITMSPSSAPAFGPPVLYPEEMSTQKRVVPEEIREVRRTGSDRGEGKICAMCQTRNPALAVQCSACGISLGTSEQDAIRQRVRSTPPRPNQSQPPGVLQPVPLPPTPSSSRRNQQTQSVPPPPTSSARDLSRSVRPSQQPPPPPSQAPRYPSGPPNWIHPSEPHPEPPPSTWDRFLKWTGLK